MIICKPKTNAYVSLGLIVALLTAGLVYLIRDFYRGPSFGIWFYLLSCALITVIIVVLLVKMMLGYKFIFAGKNEIEIRLPLRAFRKTYPLASMLGWQEEKVRANNREFRQLNLLFDDHTSFSISNHEHSAYPELVAYLSKKLPRKRLKG